MFVHQFDQADREKPVRLALVDEKTGEFTVSPPGTGRVVVIPFAFPVGPGFLFLVRTFIPFLIGSLVAFFV